MMRFLTLALLASAALPVAAHAQDDDNRTRFRAERADGTPAERGPRPDNVRQQNERGPRPERAARPERPNFSPPPAQSQAAPPAAADRGDWRGRRGDGNSNGGWRGNRDWSGGNAQTPAAPPPAVVTQPEQAQRNWNRGNDGVRRDWNRGNDARRWDGNRNPEARRDWDRNNDGRRDWDRRNDDNRRDWNRNDNRSDWNNGGWDNNRRWDGNRNARNWDRTWRNDRRYDWQRYRNSNRSAYRLPRYYAPNNWQYGYRRFDVGAYLFAGLFAQNYWIGDPYEYRLPPAYWPYQWVRYYDDALLVDTRTGYVVDVIPGIFW